MTKNEAAKLAEMVRTSPPESHDSILWAVKYHLALCLWGISTVDHTLEQILLACNTNRDDNIVQRIGLERLEELRGKKLIRSSSYGDGDFIQHEIDDFN